MDAEWICLKHDRHEIIFIGENVIRKKKTWILRTGKKASPCPFWPPLVYLQACLKNQSFVLDIPGSGCKNIFVEGKES